MDLSGYTNFIDTFSGESCILMSSAVFFLYIFYYMYEVVKRPLLATSPDGNFDRFLCEHMPVLKEKFWPSFWCVESRVQTVLATFVRTLYFPSLPYNREVFVLKDGGEVCLDTIEPKEGSPPSWPTIILLPGITGTSQSDYSKGIALCGIDIGMRVVVFNQRGIGILSKTSRTYCAANCDDLVEVVEHVRNKYKSSLLGAVGISLGGCILGKYLSTYGSKNTPLACAMLISVPWDVHLTSRSIETPYLNRMLNRHLANCIVDILKNMQHVLEPEKFVIEDILKSKTIRDIDNSYTTKQFGYKTAEDYYSDASLHDKIHNATIPVLCLSSADDPFQPIDGIPIKEAFKMGNLCIVVTYRGGHIGFMEGMLPFSKDQYMFRIYCQYFKSMFFKNGLNYFTKN